MSPGLALALALALSAGTRPSSARLRAAFETNQAAVIEVVGQKGSGSGVVVGARGQVLTAVQFVSLEDARLKVDGRELGAKVVLADATLKIALVQADGDGEWAAAAVRAEGKLSRGDWLVGIGRTRKGALEPSAGQVTREADEQNPFVDTDLGLAPGSPLFDEKGRLVALCVQRLTAGSRVLPIERVKLQLSRGAPADGAQR
jgi:S1-C subfamily serine protease